MVRRKLGPVGGAASAPQRLKPLLCFTVLPARLKPRPFKARSKSNSADESPEGECLAGPEPGGTHRLFPSTPEGWFPVTGRRQVTLTLSLDPRVCGRSLLQEVCKKCSGMLNVLPYMVPVKREIQHLVARKL